MKMHKIQLTLVGTILLTILLGTQAADEPILTPRVYLPVLRRPEPPVPQPAQLRGEALQVEGGWRLPPDGRLVTEQGAADPFPLDPALGIRGLAEGGNCLLAATDQGLYRRDYASGRWRKFSDVAGRHIAASVGGGVRRPYYIWIVPRDFPDQVWVSADEGSTWQRDDAGLHGVVVGPLRIDYNFGPHLYTMTLREGKYVLWVMYKSVDAAWREVAVLPGPTLENRPDGLPGSFAVGWPGAEFVAVAGTPEGKLYRLEPFENPLFPDPDRHWVQIADFGSSTYPLLLGFTEASLVDLGTGDMRACRSIMTAPPEWLGPWQCDPFAASDAPWGAALFGEGRPVLHWYPHIDAPLALLRDGSLYAAGIDGNVDPPTQGWRLVTDTLERTDFQAQGQQISNTIQPLLYAGGKLSWQGTNCSGTDPGFYRSDDAGLTWTAVATETVRSLVSWLMDGQDMLALTCAGPALSHDRGQTWQEPAALGWPLPVGAREVVALDGYGGQPWHAYWTGFYAAGVAANGQPFVYRAAYDDPTQQAGPWTDVTPPGLMAAGTAPELLYISRMEAGQPVYVGANGHLWVSRDDGASWQDAGAGMDGARVRALGWYLQNGTTALLAATDAGLFFTLDPVTKPWIKTAHSYGGTPTELYTTVPQNGDNWLSDGDYVYRLQGDLFVYPSE